MLHIGLHFLEQYEHLFVFAKTLWKTYRTNFLMHFGKLFNIFNMLKLKTLTHILLWLNYRTIILFSQQVQYCSHFGNEGKLDEEIHKRSMLYFPLSLLPFWEVKYGQKFSTLFNKNWWITRKFEKCSSSPLNHYSDTFI